MPKINKISQIRRYRTLRTAAQRLAKIEQLLVSKRAQLRSSRSKISFKIKCQKERLLPDKMKIKILRSKRAELSWEIRRINSLLSSPTT